MVDSLFEQRLKLVKIKLSEDKRKDNSIEIGWVHAQLCLKLTSKAEQMMLENFVRMVLENKTGFEVHRNEVQAS